MSSRGSEQRSSATTSEEEPRAGPVMPAMASCAPHTPIPPRWRQIAGHDVELGLRFHSDAQFGLGVGLHAGDLPPPEPSLAIGDRCRLAWFDHPKRWLTRGSDLIPGSCRHFSVIAR